MFLHGNSHTQPSPHTSVEKENAQGKAYISILNASEDTLLELLGNRERVRTLIDKGFWGLYITDIAESHNQSHHIHNVMADTYVAFASGTKPITLSISGLVSKTQKDDHRLDLLYMFMNCLRGTTSENRFHMPIGLTIRDTTMGIHLDTLSINDSSEKQDISLVTLSGVASAYNILPTSLNTGNYAWLYNSEDYGVA